MEKSVRYEDLVRLSDEALMRHLQAGHNDALAVLFDRYHHLVLNIALRILRNSGEAEDLMQSIFLEIFRSAAQFDATRGTTKVWILQYAYHRSFNRREYLNRRGVYNSYSEDSPAVRSQGKQPNARHLEAMEASCAVREALSQLNKAQRKIIELAFYDGLTMREIAEATGESFDSVRHHYYRGLEKLRSILCCSADSGEMEFSAGRGIAHVGS
jgi:RNA polymerase sigma-70 factor (ECF subfamily)